MPLNESLPNLSLDRKQRRRNNKLPGSTQFTNPTSTCAIQSTGACMADEDTFDIYGDDDSTSPSSPGAQSGPKKRLRRERSSSAPPLSKAKEEDEEDGDSTPRGKKVKEEQVDDHEVDIGNDEDPFREYDNHVFTQRL